MGFDGSTSAKAHAARAKKPKWAKPRKAIEAKCFDCMGEYMDGRQDCENSRCPLYYWMPYAKQDCDPAWVEWPARIQRAGKR